MSIKTTSAILFACLIAFSSTLFSTALAKEGLGQHQHGGPGMMEMKKPEPGDFIRYEAPTGMSMVIGRANPVPELPFETIVEDGKTLKVFKLPIEDITFEVYPGKTVMAWGFGGQVPGPTIRVKEGDRIRIILTNNASDKHTLHVHGQRKPLEMDGVPFMGQMPVEKGDSHTYEFTALVPGTSWYHCHVDSAHHVDMGMYGAFIVEPEREKLKFDREYTLIVDEWPTGHEHMHMQEEPEMKGPDIKDHDKHAVKTEHEGEPRHEHEGEAGPPQRKWYPETYKPYTPVYDTYTINGKSFPYTEPIDVKKGERVRIRLINTGYEPHYMHVHSHKFIVTHRDGLPVSEQIKLDTVAVGPGQRVDILLFADQSAGVWPFHCHSLNHVANDNIYPGGMLTFIRYVQ